MKLVWTARAVRRLGEIYDCIAEDSVERVVAFTEALIDASQQLARHPLSGPVLPEDGAYRQLVVDGYRIVYRVDDEAAYVMTTVSPGMLAENAL